MFDIGWKLPIEQFDDGEFIDDDAVPVVDDGDIDIFYEMNLGTHDSDVESTEESLVAHEADALALDDDDDGSEEYKDVIVRWCVHVELHSHVIVPRTLATVVWMGSISCTVHHCLRSQLESLAKHPKCFEVLQKRRRKVVLKGMKPVS